MNPPVVRPVNPLPFLVDVRVNPPAKVPAAVTRTFPPTRLAEVERSWTPARDALAAAAAAVGVVLEHGHWDWVNKTRFYRAGWHCLAAVEVGGEVQGLMAVETELRPSVLTPGRWVVYVDYVEAAPWNLTVPGVQAPRYGGVGSLLIAEAVRIAVGEAAGCRVGLHALPGVEGFYARRCGMTRVGPDRDYHDLVYFEYPDGGAARWLTSVGYSA